MRPAIHVCPRTAVYAIHVCPRTTVYICPHTDRASVRGAGRGGGGAASPPRNKGELLSNKEGAAHIMKEWKDLYRHL